MYMYYYNYSCYYEDCYYSYDDRYDHYATSIYYERQMQLTITDKNKYVPPNSDKHNKVNQAQTSTTTKHRQAQPSADKRSQATPSTNKHKRD